MNDQLTEMPISQEDILQMTADVVSAYVGNNPIPLGSVKDLIVEVHQGLSAAASAQTEKPLEKPKPAVPISKSVTDDYIICLEDGKKLKMLKRYLRTTHNMSPEEYRRRWGLPSDYPMVAPSYAKRRSEFAKKIGLGKGVRRKDG